ncbi:MAG: mandelate racemase/muconate lactonizing enzyme family protein [Paenibacillaceae bacterium]|nr:mandelate racemase/muconate lactonizing enzyme family protein [Paenibacillaceae bacterium]
MRIIKIEPMGLRYIEPNDYNSTRHTMFVRVETDEGIVGWGEGMAMWPEAVAATVAVVEHGLGRLLLDADPLETLAHWHRLKEHTWWYGLEGGIASFAISALDMALWDIKGKALEQPLYKLLGGACRDKLPANASIHAKLATHEENAREIAGYFAEGYRSCKVGFGKNGHARLGQTMEYDIGFVREVRKRIGPDAELMVDIGANVKWDVAHAVKMTKAFAEHGVDWIEDPFPPNRLADYRELRAATNARIVTGERLTTLDQYDALIRSGVADVIAIDPARTDGITGFGQIAALVGSAGRKFNTHCWCSALTTAASLHLSIASPLAPIMELKPLRNPMQHDIARNPIEHRDGWVHKPEEPGLGVDIDEEAVRRLRFL